MNEKEQAELEKLEQETRKLRLENNLEFERRLQHLIQQTSTARVAEQNLIQQTNTARAAELHYRRNALWYPIFVAAALLGVGVALGGLLVQMIHYNG